jgi:hypothetical protein
MHRDRGSGRALRHASERCRRPGGDAVGVCAARDRPLQRSRAHARQSARHRPRRAAAPAALRIARGPRCIRAHIRRCADDARPRSADRGPGAQARDALPVERRQVGRDVFRPADRLARCADRAHGGRPAPAAGGGRRDPRAQRPLRRGRHRGSALLPVPSPSIVESRAGLLDGMGAQARQAARIQPAAARPIHRS